ncbi:MAG: HDOD domain-containing protein [Gammaproteobacteria bacterium]|nr:HDOD domain-containing protein [Gammaproteobacteria bacterium]
MTSLNALLEQIHSAQTENRLQLPSLPDVVLAIREAVHDERKGVAHVARLLQLDPILSARVLKIANSPLYRTGQPLTDIKHAINHLGLAMTRNLVTCLAMHNLFDVRSFAMKQRIRELWQHSAQVAAITQVLAKSQRGLSPDKALLAGLLHDIGVLPILVYADNYPDLCDNNRLLDQAIRGARAELGNSVLKNWLMDPDIVNIPLVADDYSYDHAGEADYADLVIMAQIHSGFGQQTPRPMLDLNKTPAFSKLTISKLGPDASLELLQQANREIAATIRMLQN